MSGDEHDISGAVRREVVGDWEVRASWVPRDYEPGARDTWVRRQRVVFDSAMCGELGTADLGWQQQSALRWKWFGPDTWCSFWDEWDSRVHLYQALAAVEWVWAELLVFANRGAFHGCFLDGPRVVEVGRTILFLEPVLWADGDRAGGEQSGEAVNRDLRRIQSLLQHAADRAQADPGFTDGLPSGAVDELVDFIEDLDRVRRGELPPLRKLTPTARNWHNPRTLNLGDWLNKYENQYDEFFEQGAQAGLARDVESWVAHLVDVWSGVPDDALLELGSSEFPVALPAGYTRVIRLLLTLEDEFSSGRTPDTFEARRELLIALHEGVSRLGLEGRAVPSIGMAVRLLGLAPEAGGSPTRSSEVQPPGRRGGFDLVEFSAGLPGVPVGAVSLAITQAVAESGDNFLRGLMRLVIQAASVRSREPARIRARARELQPLLAGSAASDGRAVAAPPFNRPEEEGDSGARSGVVARAVDQQMPLPADPGNRSRHPGAPRLDAQAKPELPGPVDDEDALHEPTEAVPPAEPAGADATTVPSRRTAALAALGFMGCGGLLVCGLAGVGLAPWAGEAFYSSARVADAVGDVAAEPEAPTGPGSADEQPADFSSPHGAREAGPPEALDTGALPPEPVEHRLDSAASEVVAGNVERVASLSKQPAPHVPDQVDLLLVFEPAVEAMELRHSEGAQVIARPSRGRRVQLKGMPVGSYSVVAVMMGGTRTPERKFRVETPALAAPGELDVIACGYVGRSVEANCEPCRTSNPEDCKP